MPEFLLLCVRLSSEIRSEIFLQNICINVSILFGGIDQNLDRNFGTHLCILLYSGWLCRLKTVQLLGALYRRCPRHQNGIAVIG